MSGGGGRAGQANPPASHPQGRDRRCPTGLTWAVLVTAHLPCGDRGASAAGVSKVLGSAIGGDPEGGSCFKTCSANSLYLCLLDKVGMSQRFGRGGQRWPHHKPALLLEGALCLSFLLHRPAPSPLPHPGWDLRSSDNWPWPSFSFQRTCDT